MPEAARILIADDEPEIREILREVLEQDGYRVTVAKDGREAIQLLNDKPFELLLSDLKMPHATGIDVLRHIHDNKMPVIGIIATAFGNVENTKEAMKLGAYDFISKPFHLGELKLTIQNALKLQDLEQEATLRRQEVRSESLFHNIIGQSPKMRALFDLMRVVAHDADSTVLITGESGTGKELCARAIHYNSPRKHKPLIPVNCGAIPEALLESELFGHVRGAFTGAHMDRIGRFKLADGGTIFLDEIGEMSPVLQVKLLRVLQEHEFEPVGAMETEKVNVRVITATNRNLEEMVAEGKFREDLYFRLNVIPLHIPALRERLDDIDPLLRHFVAQFNKQKGRSVRGFSDEAVGCLKRYEWRGNVRELVNLVERMITLYDADIIGVEHLPDKIRQRTAAPSSDFGALVEFPEEGVDLNKLVEEFEAHMICQALNRAEGVKNRAAKLLNIKRTTLVEKMKKRMSGNAEIFEQHGIDG
ncbi:sigma-54-dependent Fis family transcriptional regulator [Candidatus Sumerlaeota bacterium]|nr:sigma-54-dependent Fis family transcriptional regulator [Candidatus Sumerlaeota bacterium]